MNFSTNCKPNFSIPPPPIPMPVMNNGVLGSIPSQFPRYSGPMQNQSMPPFHQQRYTNSCPNMQGNPNVHPIGQVFQNNSMNRHIPPPNHMRQQVNYNSGNAFDVGIHNGNNVNNHSFPFCPPQQSYNNNNPRNHQPPSNQRGRGFQNNRGRGGSRGRGGFMNKNNNNKNSNNIKSQGQHKKRKEKVDKRDLPENNAFFCDICDRGFKTKEKYQEHIDGHQKCSYKGCPFVAAPKLVQLHMTMQHKSGLAKKIWSVESEEDIQKWREERRRNYPTAANIKKKKELMAERVQRGEILETKNFSKMKRQNRNDHNRGRGHGRNNRNHRRHNKRFHQETRESIDEDADDDDGLPIEMKIVRSSDPMEVGSLEESIDDDRDRDVGRVKETGLDLKEKGSGNEIPEKENDDSVSGLSLLASYGCEDSSDDHSSDEDEADFDSNNCSKSKPEDARKQHTSEYNTKDKSDHASIHVPPPFIPNKDAELTPCLDSQQDSVSFQQPASPDSTSSTSSSPFESFVKDPFNLSTNRNESQCGIKNKSSMSSQSLDHSCDYAPVGDRDKHALNVLNGEKDEKSLDLGKAKSFDCLDLHEAIKSSSAHSSKISAIKVRSTNCSPELKDSKKGMKRHHNEYRLNDENSVDKTDFRGPNMENKRRRLDQRHQQKSYTLLEKLLAPQIRRERNKILQCVYYIVKNKFFDDGSKISIN